MMGEQLILDHQLIELECLDRSGLDLVWDLKRVGAEGEVLLLRAGRHGQDADEPLGDWADEGGSSDKTSKALRQCRAAGQKHTEPVAGRIYIRVGHF